MILDHVAKKWIYKIRANGHIISIVKAISWRVVGTMDTMFISWMVTGKINLAITIASVEVVTKIVLFYLHEQAWNKVWIRDKELIS